MRHISWRVLSPKEAGGRKARAPRRVGAPSQIPPDMRSNTAHGSFEKHAHVSSEIHTLPPTDTHGGDLPLASFTPAVAAHNACQPAFPKTSARVSRVRSSAAGFSPNTITGWQALTSRECGRHCPEACSSSNTSPAISPSPRRSARRHGGSTHGSLASEFAFNQFNSKGA
ncbi:unnamed protein product [Trypanosoma congolense IL3000]|uniref:WGS project CAEQ00000000 data, annotated contig 890 n=1 Tax=Trypanosoma congolense (strain IL3000) TaxID=1068625 RepID=F9WJA1_TRYCI|nr:unnamed protein product [Trypanosoma congolense IL3000]